MKLGAICSAGGSAFFTAVDILVENKFLGYKDIFVVTDRPCGAEHKAEERGASLKKIYIRDKKEFGRSCKIYFNYSEVDSILLFFQRLISDDIYNYFKTANIHPSLLPAFPGFGAIKTAHEMQCRLLGATLHEVTEGIDNGPILAQVSSPVSPEFSIDLLNRYSYIQKVYLTVLAAEIFNEGSVELHRRQRMTFSASPALTSRGLIESFDKFQKAMDIKAIEP